MIYSNRTIFIDKCRINCTSDQYDGNNFWSHIWLLHWTLMWLLLPLYSGKNKELPMSSRYSFWWYTIRTCPSPFECCESTKSICQIRFGLEIWDDAEASCCCGCSHTPSPSAGVAIHARWRSGAAFLSWWRWLWV